jgi:hypothetical protein
MIRAFHIVVFMANGVLRSLLMMLVLGKCGECDSHHSGGRQQNKFVEKHNEEVS